MTTTKRRILIVDVGRTSGLLAAALALSAQGLGATITVKDESELTDEEARQFRSQEQELLREDERVFRLSAGLPDPCEVVTPWRYSGGKNTQAWRPETYGKRKRRS